MPVLDPSAIPAGYPGNQHSGAFLEVQPAASPAAEAGGVVHAFDGELIAIDASGGTAVLATGDPVGPGDVLITRAGGGALIDLGGGASLTMSGEARAEILAGGAGHAHLVAHAGAFVVQAAAGPAGETGSVTVETGAAILAIKGGPLAFRYALESGLAGAIVPGAGPDAVRVQIANDSGVHALDPQAPGFAVTAWSDRPAPMSAAAGEQGWLPAEVLAEDGGGPLDALAAAGTEGPGEAVPLPAGDEQPEGEEPEGGPDFETGAGPAEAGDPTFTLASPYSPPRGLADHAFAAAPLPTVATADAPSALVAPRAVPSAAQGHAVDALLLWQPPVDMPLAPPPPADPGPHLRGWAPGGHTWSSEGNAWVSGGDFDRSGDGDAPLVLIRPTEGRSMAALEASDGFLWHIESLLDLQHGKLNGLVNGVTAHEGSAMSTSIALKAGQALVFDVLFDAVGSATSNDFAAFTISGGSVGDAFVLSSVAASGDLGASPWQTMRYTVGASGTYTVGFVILDDVLVDDGMPAGLSRLYVDGMRSTLDPSGLQVIAERTDAFGGRFELLAPQAEEVPGQGRLITGFEDDIGPMALIGSVTIAGHFAEPDGCRSVYAPSEGASMAVLTARGAMRPQLDAFLGLEKPAGTLTALPIDADGSFPTFGAATRLMVAVAAGDRVSFDWMFDAGDRLPDNDFAVFTISASDGSRVFKLADVRATGDAGATGWRTSVYTAAEDEELTIGFAVVNDRISGPPGDPKNSRLLVDNVWLNRDFADGYQLADLPDPGDLATLPTA